MAKLEQTPGPLAKGEEGCDLLESFSSVSLPAGCPGGPLQACEFLLDLRQAAQKREKDRPSGGLF